MHIPVHAAEKLPGYASVLRILDAVIQQISEDGGASAADKIVESIARMPVSTTFQRVLSRRLQRVALDPAAP